MACAVGACNVEAAGAVSGVRSWDETVQRVQAGWARQPLVLSTPGWTVDETGIWHGDQGAVPKRNHK